MRRAIVILLGLTCAAAAHAHHGWSEYDSGNTLSYSLQPWCA